MIRNLRGMLYGLAVGDALGAPVEFRERGEFSPVTTYRSGGPFSLNAGDWTDDTSMALALADSLSKGWDLADQMKCYLDWYERGRFSVNGRCFDIGTTTRYALEAFNQHGDPITSGDANPEASGNGCIMRMAPVVIKFHYEDAVELAERCELSSLITHASQQCASACRYFGLVLAGLAYGYGKERVLTPDWEWVRQARERKPFHSLVEQIINESYKDKTEHAIKGSGWVIASLEASLWALWNSNSFEEAVLKAVNLGDDSDTTGAVTGQLAGALWGEDGIPKHLIDGLSKKDMIETALTGLGVGK